LDEESCKYTAFAVPGRGLFEYTRVIFGLKNGPAILQRLVDSLFGPKYEPVFCYLDDLIVLSESFEHHIQLLQSVLRILIESNLSINFKKSVFAVPETVFLGFKVSKEGIAIDHDRIIPLLNVPAPTNRKKVKSFVSAASFYRKHIKDFAAAPLNKLTSPKTPFLWTLDCQNSFEALKRCLVSGPILANSISGGRYVVEYYASNCAALYQWQKDEKRLISYASKKFTDSQIRCWSTLEKELAALLWSIDEKFRPFIEFSEFDVVTDNYALSWVKNLKNPTGKLARWSYRLQQYDFKICHNLRRERIISSLIFFQEWTMSSL